MSSHTSALGFTSSYVWAEIEGTPRVVSARNSEGEQTTFSYAPESRESWATDDEGRVAHWVYDEHFQITECTDLDGATYQVRYNEAGMPVTIALPGERKVSFEYDAAARIIAETDPLGRTTHTIYDGNSLRVKEVALCDGCRWRSEFDDLGRLTATIDPLGRTDRYDYGPGPNPFPLLHVDARGGKKTMQWDRRGQLLAYTDCSGKVTTYRYDADGGLASVTDALGQVTRYERLRTRELVKVTLADGSTEEFTYDAARLLVEQRSSALETRHWARNARGQVVQPVDPARRQLRYRFDSHGRLVEMSSDASTRYLFGYDRGDRLAHELRPDGVERHLRYDDAGELRSIDMIGHLPGAAPAQARPRRTTLFERDAMGRLLAQATETGTDAYVWSDGDRLLEAVRTPTPLGESLGIAPAAVRFEYDKAGRVLAEHGAEGVVGFAFDDLDNMTKLHLPHGQHIDLLTYGAGHVHQIRATGRVISDFERDDLHREIECTSSTTRWDGASPPPTR